MAGVLARVGETSRAEELIREMGEAPRPIIGRVLYHVLCGDIDATAGWYERAINEREPFALVFASVPLTSDFRRSPRWPKLANMMNMPLHPAI